MPVHLQLCRASISLSDTPASRSSAAALSVIVLVYHQRRILSPKLVVVSFDFAMAPTAVLSMPLVLPVAMVDDPGLICSDNAPF